jgi:hypothetical protein
MEILARGAWLGGFHWLGLWVFVVGLLIPIVVRYVKGDS